MIIIHHLEDSRSQRIIWLTEALGLAYKVKRYKRNQRTNLAPKELLEIHPLGKSPVIEDDGIILAETGAIFEYLLGKYDTDFRLHPKLEVKNYHEYLFWLHFAEGSLMGPLVMKLVHTTALSKVPFFIKPVATAIFGAINKGYLNKQIGTLFTFIENHLSQHKFFFGDRFSALDILMSFPLEASVASGMSKANYPAIANFVSEMKKREDYQAAIKEGGPYKF